MVSGLKNVKGRAKTDEDAEGAAVLPQTPVSLMHTQVRPCDVVTGLTGTKKRWERINPSHFCSDIAEEIHLTIELNGVEIVL